MNLTETNLRYFGIAMILYVVLTVTLSAIFTSLSKKAAQSAPMMRLEFVKTPTEVKDIVGEDETARTDLKKALLLDSFAFVPVYFAFLIVMSFLLSTNQADWAQIAYKLVLVLAVFAAFSDLTENRYSYLALENQTENVMLIYWAAHAKWAAIFLSTGILAFIFCRLDVWAIAFLILFLTSNVGLVLTVGSLLGKINLIEKQGLLTSALALQLLILLIIGIMLQFERFRSDFLHR